MKASRIRSIIAKILAPAVVALGVAANPAISAEPV
jgi:hypothetical protein